MPGGPLPVAEATGQPSPRPLKRPGKESRTRTAPLEGARKKSTILPVKQPANPLVTVLHATSGARTGFSAPSNCSQQVRWIERVSPTHGTRDHPRRFAGHVGVMSSSRLFVHLLRSLCRSWCALYLCVSPGFIRGYSLVAALRLWVLRGQFPMFSADTLR